MQIETGHWPKHPKLSGWLLKNKRGEEVRIVCVDALDWPGQMLLSAKGKSYFPDGQYYSGGVSDEDLIIPPDPYEHLRAAFKAGQKIQYNFGGIVEDWGDIDGEPNWFKQPAARFRVKPHPSMVALCPSDVPIGSACRLIGKESWSLVDGCGNDGITCGGRIYSFENMQTELEINRNDGRGWVRCEKPAK